MNQTLFVKYQKCEMLFLPSPFLIFLIILTTRCRLFADVEFVDNVESVSSTLETFEASISFDSENIKCLIKIIKAKQILGKVLLQKF
jgi:hypothetical protein